MQKPWIITGILKPIEKRTKFTENELELKMLQKRGITRPFSSPIGILLTK